MVTVLNILWVIVSATMTLFAHPVIYSADCYRTPLFDFKTRKKITTYCSKTLMYSMSHAWLLWKSEQRRGTLLTGRALLMAWFISFRALLSRDWAWSSLLPAPLSRLLLLHQPLEVEACRTASLAHALPSYPFSRREKGELGKNLS